jgi:hypothetical protein
MLCYSFQGVLSLDVGAQAAFMHIFFFTSGTLEHFGRHISELFFVSGQLLLVQINCCLEGCLN